MGPDSTSQNRPSSTEPTPTSPVPFGANEMRLSARQWLAVVAVLVPIVFAMPSIWTKIEKFETDPTYRIPYTLSRDYWLYKRRLSEVATPDHMIILGDSVVWGEYVRPDGAWSVFLNKESNSSGRFINGGVNGLFPLALEGILRHYGRLPKNQKVLLHCNPLWLTSPQADLSSEKEEHFNHSRLVPQFSPRIPCYRADANERLSAVIQNRWTFMAWADHLQDAYFEQKSLPKWTLADDGGDPPQYPNSLRNPLGPVTLQVPVAPEIDPLRGPESPRHKPWSTNGVGTTRFEWVDLNASLQWAAFQRTTRLLRDRGNDVFVVVGPFNEHMLTYENRQAYFKIRNGMVAWLEQEHIPQASPEALPSQLYADASHPLTAGYQLLARRILSDAGFRQWMDSIR